MSEAKCETGWGARCMITPPRSLIPFAIDPPPPGEGGIRRRATRSAAQRESAAV